MSEKTELQKRIESGEQVLLAEIAPPKSSDPEAVRTAAKCYAGKVHALGVSDNRDGVCMSAVAAASLVASVGVEPLLHVVTRDRNRMALMADCLGAKALGIRNLLCTTGTHQTLGACGAARNVFDIDSIQLLRALAVLENDASVVGEQGLNGPGDFYLGGVVSPYADPIEMHMMRVAKKCSAGARFLVTQPVFDIDRFEMWWKEITKRGFHEKVAIVAGIRLLADPEEANAYAKERPNPMVPDDVLERVASKKDEDSQRAEGIKIALETIERLSAIDGLRGFEINADADHRAALEIIKEFQCL